MTPKRVRATASETKIVRVSSENVRTKTGRPIRNRIRAISSNAGIDAMKAGTFHLSHASNRT